MGDLFLSIAIHATYSHKYRIMTIPYRMVDFKNGMIPPNTEWFAAMQAFDMAPTCNPVVVPWLSFTGYLDLRRTV